MNQYRLTEAEEQISDLEDRMVGITAEKQNIEKKIEKHEDCLRDLRDSIKCTNIHIIGVPEEETGRGPEKTFEKIITGNFPNMGKEIVSQVQETQILSGRINSKRHLDTQ